MAAAATAAGAPSSASSDHIAAVYAAWNKLTELGADAGKDKAAFGVLLDAVKGDSKVKQLAAQHIPRFLKFFPDLSERGLNAQLDLCEDEELPVRVHAIRSLVELCKGSPVHTQRIADCLGQLLVAEDTTELATVKRSFTSLFEIDAKAAFAALLNQIKDGAELPLRSKGLDFFKALWGDTKPPKKGGAAAAGGKDAKAGGAAAGSAAAPAATGPTPVRALVDKDVELQKVVAAAIKKVIQSVGADEFKYFVSVLQSMKVVRDDPAFPGEVAAIVSKQANLSAAFDVR